MAEDLHIVSGTKKEQYEALLPQIKGLLQGEEDWLPTWQMSPLH
jgi:GAF domain-containing protein